MKPTFLVMLGILSGCSSAPLPDPPSPNPSDPQAPAAATPYRSVMAGTAAYVPVGLKPWRELNEEVTPRAGRSP